MTTKATDTLRGDLDEIMSLAWNAILDSDLIHRAARMADYGRARPYIEALPELVETLRGLLALLDESDDPVLIRDRMDAHAPAARALLARIDGGAR